VSPCGLPSAGYPANARWHVFSLSAAPPRIQNSRVSPEGLAQADHPKSPLIIVTRNNHGIVLHFQRCFLTFLASGQKIWYGR